MSAAESALWEAIGRYGAEIATTGRMAPPEYLLNAVRALTTSERFTREDVEHLTMAADLRDRTGVRDGGWTSGALRDIAARIEALLPPASSETDKSGVE